MWPRGQKVPLIISVHPAKFGGPRRCEREEIPFFVRHLTSRDFVVRESCEFMGKFPSSLMTTPQSLVVINLLEEEIIKLAIFHVTSRDQVVRESCDIMGEFSSS